ncbi:MAG: hypothetical protein E7277_06900 [Lachnospiraceae bacterium]|jgi:hypothetical protein|nr:hypothetical protein [Lachnospiraceae bacterium]
MSKSAEEYQKQFGEAIEKQTKVKIAVGLLNNGAEDQLLLASGISGEELAMAKEVIKESQGMR